MYIIYIYIYIILYICIYIYSLILYIYVYILSYMYIYIIIIYIQINVYAYIYIYINYIRLHPHLCCLKPVFELVKSLYKSKAVGAVRSFHGSVEQCSKASTIPLLLAENSYGTQRNCIITV